MRDSSSSLTLSWEKVSKWFAQTTDQQFRCRRFVTGEDVMTEPGEVRYQLYGPDGARLGPPCASFSEACEYMQHALRHERTQK